MGVLPPTRIAALLVLVAGGISPAVVRAQADSHTVAQALFDDAKQLMQQNRWAEACPKLAESQRIDPGVGTLLNLAVCHEHVGQLATAWSEYKDAAARARTQGEAQRAQFAADRAAALEPRLSLVAIGVDAQNPSGIRVTLDGTEIGRAAWGTRFPLDGGPHVVGASAAGYQTWQQTVQVPTEGARQTIAVPPLVPAASSARTGTSTAAPVAPPSSPSTAPASSSGSARTALTWASAGLGVAGVVVGSAFGLAAKSTYDDAFARCASPTNCPEDSVTASQRAHDQATASTIAFAVGGALLATGVVLYLTRPVEGSSPSAARLQAAPRLGTREAGLDLEMAW